LRSVISLLTPYISKYYRNKKTGNIEIYGVSRDITDRKRS